MPELELLRRFAPPPTAPTPEAREAAREALLKRTRRRRLPRRSLLLIPAVAAAAAAIAIVWPDRDPTVDERPATRTPAAHGELTPTRPLTPGTYLYTRSRSEYLTTVGDTPGYSAMVPSDRESWMALDGTGWMKTRNGALRWLSDRDRERWIAAGRPDLTGKGDDTAIGVDDQGGPAPMSTPRLPTEAGALYTQLSRGRTPDQTFQELQSALQEAYTTSAQRAALYAAAARIPGVSIQAGAIDHDGRAGTGFTFDDTDNKIRTQVVIDARTHALLGATTTTLPGYWNDYKPGTLIGWTVIDRVEVVDRIKQRPDAG